ncbi:MAG TPA: GNAT family N-acetyltransferase [Anaeromyxobacteraceae bacterium]|nr:GNAT family N-acetyltransferase [Anaeromyxobacteraceae bacterium]
MQPLVGIRRATPEDAEAIWSTHRTSVLGLTAPEYTQDQIAAWLDLTPDDFRASMARGELFFVAESAGDVLGFAAVRGDEARAVYVRPDAVRRGIGTRLLDAVEREVRAGGGTAVTCEATLNAVPFYLANGYVETGRSDRTVRGVALPSVRMTKDL